MLLRGLYFENWTLPQKPSNARSANQFADAVGAYLPDRYRFNPMMTSEAVFAAASEFITPGEAEKVRAQLPEAIRDLWPHPIFV